MGRAAERQGDQEDRQEEVPHIHVVLPFTGAAPDYSARSGLTGSTRTARRAVRLQTLSDTFSPQLRDSLAHLTP